MVLILRLIWIEEMSSSIFGHCFMRATSKSEVAHCFLKNKLVTQNII